MIWWMEEILYRLIDGWWFCLGSNHPLGCAGCFNHLQYGIWEWIRIINDMGTDGNEWEWFGQIIDPIKWMVKWVYVQTWPILRVHGHPIFASCRCRYCQIEWIHIRLEACITSRVLLPLVPRWGSLDAGWQLMLRRCCKWVIIENWHVAVRYVPGYPEETWIQSLVNMTKRSAENRAMTSNKGTVSSDGWLVFFQNH